MSRARPCTLIVKDDPFSDRPPRILQRDDLAVIGELVSLAGFDPEELDHVRVYMDGAEIERARWPFVVANGHVEIVRVPLGGDGDKILRTVLTIAVVVASFYVGGTVTSSLLNAGWKAGAAQAAGAAAATAVSTVGTLAINAILPPPALSGNYAADPDPVYFLEGARNQLALNQPIQTVIGRHRLMPRLAARPWPEVRGDDTYFYLVLDYGPIGVEVSDRKVGDTPLASFDGVEVQSRLTASDPHPAMASRQTVPTAVGATLAEGDWEGRFTASNTIDADVILFFPLGLGKINDKGKPRSHTVQVKFRYREVFNAGEPGETYGDWSFADAAAPGRIPFRNFGYLDGLEDLGAGPVAGTFSFTESKPGQPFYRQIGFSFPSEGTWEVELQRVGADGDVIDRIYDDIVFQTLLSKRDEAIVQRDDVAYEVVRFKASEELNGAVDTYNAVVGRLMPAFPDAVLDQSDLSGVTAADLSEERVSRNMWEQILWMARNGFEARRPYSDSEINWPSFAAAAKDARDRGKYFDYVVTRDLDLDELIGLAEFAGEGRCYNYNNLLEAHVDRPQPAPTHFFREGTARNLSFTLTFPQDVHAYRVTFNDEADGYRQREVTIYVGGHTKATATRFERFSIAGKVNWTDLHEALEQHYQNSRQQRKTGTIEVPVDRVDNTLKPMALITVATRVLAQARDSGVVRAVQTDGSGDVTGLTLDQAIPQGPSAGDLSLKWVRQSATGEAVFSGQAFSMVTPGSDGRSPAVSFETPLSGADRPQAGDEYIIGPSSVELHDFLLDRAEDNRDGWLRLYLKAYAPGRWSTPGFSVPAYTPAYDLPINPAPPAPVFGLATSDEQRIVVTFTVPDGYAATIDHFRVWRADAPEAGDANPGALGTFEPLADLPGDARRLVDTARTAGDRVVYRVQAVAESGRLGPVLETTVINAADDIGQPQNVAVTPGSEPGPQGAVKPLLTVTFDPDPRLALLDAVVSIRKVALDGQGVRLAEGLQPAFDQGFIADPASGRLVIRGVTAGATYDVRVYFRGRRGESGAPVTVADLVAPAVDTALAAGSAAAGGALAGQLDGFGVAIANAESSASAAQTSAAAAEGKADTALSQAGDALADAAANTTGLTLVASSTAAGVSNPSRKGWTADYDKLAANANDIPVGNWINNAVQITDDGGFLAGPKTLVRYYPEMILEVETVIEVVNVGDGTFHPSITVLSIEEDGSVVYPNWTVFSDAEQTTTGVYRVVRRFRGPSAPDVTNSQALENLGNGTLLRIASSARGGGAGCTYRILSTTWRDLTKTLDVEVQAQNAQSTASTAVSNYDALSLTINNPTTGLAARALQADLLTLEGQVGSQGNLISTAVNDISAIEADLVDKQNQINAKAALTYVDTAIAGVEGSVATQAERITAIYEGSTKRTYRFTTPERFTDDYLNLNATNTISTGPSVVLVNDDPDYGTCLEIIGVNYQLNFIDPLLIDHSRIYEVRVRAKVTANGPCNLNFLHNSWNADGVIRLNNSQPSIYKNGVPYDPDVSDGDTTWKMRIRGANAPTIDDWDDGWTGPALDPTDVYYRAGFRANATGSTNATIRIASIEIEDVTDQVTGENTAATNKVEYTSLIQANSDDISANLTAFNNYVTQTNNTLSSYNTLIQGNADDISAQQSLTTTMSSQIGSLEANTSNLRTDREAGWTLNGWSLVSDPTYGPRLQSPQSNSTMYPGERTPIGANQIFRLYARCLHKQDTSAPANSVWRIGFYSFDASGSVVDNNQQTGYIGASAGTVNELELLIGGQDVDPSLVDFNIGSGAVEIRPHVRSNPSNPADGIILLLDWEWEQVRDAANLKATVTSHTSTLADLETDKVEVSAFNSYTAATDNTLSNYSTLIQGNADDISAQQLSLTNLSAQTTLLERRTTDSFRADNSSWFSSTSKNWFTVVDDPTYGKVTQSAAVNGTLYPEYRIPINPKEVWRLKVRVRCLQEATGLGYAAFRLGHFSFNVSGSLVDNNVQQPGQNMTAGQIVDYECYFYGSQVVNPQFSPRLAINTDGGALTFSPHFRSNPTSPSDGVFQILDYTLERVTDAVSNKAEYIALIQANTDDISSTVSSLTTLSARMDAKGTAAGQLLPNWNFKELDSEGKPAGIYGVEGYSLRDQIQASTTGLKITGAPDSTVAFGFPAIPIDDKLQYKVTIRHKSSFAHTAGLYLRMNELASALPAGKTHVGGSSASSVSQPRTGYVDIAPSNGPMPGTSIVEVTYTYTPTAGTRFASFSMYNWSAFSGDYEVESVQITPTIESTVATVTALYEALAGSNGIVRSRFALNTSVPGATAFLTAQAYNSSGVAYSDVGIGADAFAVYNPTTSGWQKALAVANGNVTIFGDLDVGGSIVVGSVRQKVALEPLVVYAADGDAISFGGDFGSPPKVTIFSDGLDPLAAGETYELKVLNLTGTGGTAQLRVKTPGATVGLTSSADAAGTGGDPDRVMHKSDAADAYNGSYRFTVSGEIYIDHNGSGPFFLIDGMFDLLIDDGGGWDVAATRVISSGDINDPAFNPYTPQSAYFSFQFTQSVQFNDPIGQHAGEEFGIDVASGNFQNLDLVSVYWLKQTGSTYSSASPNGEQARIEFQPNNQ